MEFDDYATDYDAALERGISLSGESKDYFAHHRAAWLSGSLAALREHPQHIMDYGCGTGSAVPFLAGVFATASIVGVDVSAKSLQVARSISARATFLTCDDYVPQAAIDLVFCNGVFHHIGPPHRAAAIDYIYRSLRPGGVFALWENNPWNPGARYIMSRIPFDRDAIPLGAPAARRLLGAGGFEIVRTDYLFVFPRLLSWCRALEPRLSGLPLGAQYQVLCRRPDSPRGRSPDGEAVNSRGSNMAVGPDAASVPLTGARRDAPTRPRARLFGAHSSSGARVDPSRDRRTVA